VLSIGNDILQNSFHSIRQDLHNNFVDATHQADRTEVFDLNSPHFLRDKSDERSIQTFLKFTPLVKLKKDFHDLFSENIPTGLEESHRKAIWTNALSHSCLLLPQRPPFPESSFQPNSLLLTNRMKWETIHIRVPMLTLEVEVRVKMNYKLLNIGRIGGGNAIDNQLLYSVATSVRISNPVEELGIFIPLS
jgi:hypothetical protein